MNQLLQSHGNEFPKKKGSLQKFLGAFSILIFPFMLWGNQALAAPIHGTSALGELIGSRSVGNGLTGTNNYDNGVLTFSWDIVPSGSNFVYTYTLTAPGLMDISHLTLEVSDDCVNTTCIFGVSGSPVEFGPNDAITNGFKLDFGGSSPFTWSFTSNRSPVYHDVCGRNGGGMVPVISSI